MEEKEKEKGAGTISRRDFIKDAGLVIGGAAVGAAAGAGITYAVVPAKEVVKEVPKEVVKEVTKEVKVPVTGVLEPAFEPEESSLGPWGTNSTDAAMADVKNGKIVRIRPFHWDWKYSEAELAPAKWKFEAKHRKTGEVKTFETLNRSRPSYLNVGYKKRVYSPNRILYPLKRVDWDPKGERHPENRGKSKFKRITWDEAATLIASEIKRVQEKYGPYAIYTAESTAHKESKKVHSGAGQQNLLLSKVGGYTGTVRNADSWEGWYWGTKHVWGEGDMRRYGIWAQVGLAVPGANQLLDVSQNTDMLVLQGCDGLTTVSTSGHVAAVVCRWFRELGIKFVHIAPDVNYTNAAHPDKWIPILPNTDMALQLAIAYVWMTEGTYDKAYIATHSVGFDKFEAYVLGKEDGVPKTPAWASPRCGVKEWTIKALARAWAKKRTSVMHGGNGGSFIRGPYSHEPARLESYLLAMQGLGKPGVHQLWNHREAPPPQVSVSPGAAVRGITPFTPQLIPNTLLHHAILNPPVSHYGTTSISSRVEDQFKKYTYPIPKDQGGTEIHMIWTDKPCRILCWNGSYLLIQALRNPKIECVVAQHQWMESDCLFADIILPINTILEEEDINNCGFELNLIVYQRSAIKPIGESKSDYEAVLEVAKKLETYGGVYAGLYEKVTGGKTIEDWKKVGFDATGAAKNITWDKLKEKGYYVSPVTPNWQEEPRGLIGFYQDPVKNPLTTPSGKLEFYSARLAENFPDDKERPPVAKYVIGGPGWTYDESLEGERCKKYPLLLVSNHPRWRIHNQHDDIPWLREIPTCKVKGPDGYMYEPLWIHPTDAAKRGIKHGDIVKMYNHRGITLGGAYVTQRIIPGAVYQDHGARLDLITSWPDELINRGGDNNVISPEGPISKNCWGMATSGYLVECEKLSGNEYEEWRKKYPEAFARDYDPAYGLKFDAWIEGGT